MKIRQKSLMANKLGLWGAILAIHNHIDECYGEDKKITAIKRADGIFSFYEKKKKKTPPPRVQREIVAKIKQGLTEDNV